MVCCCCSCCCWLKSIFNFQFSLIVMSLLYHRLNDLYKNTKLNYQCLYIPESFLELTIFYNLTFWWWWWCLWCCFCWISTIHHIEFAFYTEVIAVLAIPCLPENKVKETEKCLNIKEYKWKINKRKKYHLHNFITVCCTTMGGLSLFCYYYYYDWELYAYILSFRKINIKFT